MLTSFLKILAVVGIFVVVAFFMLVICLCIAAAPEDRTREDEDQINFMKHYFNRKDDNND